LGSFVSKQFNTAAFKLKTCPWQAFPFLSDVCE